MSEYPRSVMTRDRKGNEEVRLLVDKGVFVRYHYMDPVTGEIVEKEKMSIILRNTRGEEDHLYIIPLQPNKGLVIRPKVENRGRRVWNPETKEVESLFD